MSERHTRGSVLDWDNAHRGSRWLPRIMGETVKQYAAPLSVVRRGYHDAYRLAVVLGVELGARALLALQRENPDGEL